MARGKTPANATSGTAIIGKTVDDALVAIERDHPRLKGVLPKGYARPGLDTARRDSAISKRGASPQSLSAAKDNQRSPRRRLTVCLPQTAGPWMQISRLLKSKGG